MMKTKNKNSAIDHSDDQSRNRNLNSDNTLNRDINKNSQAERFPESSMNKSSREDAEKTNKEEDDSTIESLADDVHMVGSRATSSSPDDIAGVADLDKGMRRAKRR